MRNLLNRTKLNKKNKTPLKNGERGTFQTIQSLLDIAHEQKINPKIRNFALKIINNAGVRDHDYLNEALAIGKYVQEKYRYVRDPKRNEYIITPLEAIQNLDDGTFRGDCEDMSLLIGTLIASLGGNPYFTIVKYNKDAKGYQHIYITVIDRNQLKKKEKLVIDAIKKDRAIGYEPRSDVKKYIKI
jgi:hypothetical protein